MMQESDREQSTRMENHYKELEAYEKMLREKKQYRDTNFFGMLPRPVFFMVIAAVAVAMFINLSFTFLDVFRSDAAKAEVEANELIAKVAEDYGSVLYALQSTITCKCDGGNDGCSQNEWTTLTRELGALGRSQLYVSVQANRLFPNTQFSEGHRAMVESLTTLSREVRSGAIEQCSELKLSEKKISEEVVEFLSLAGK